MGNFRVTGLSAVVALAAMTSVDGAAAQWFAACSDVSFLTSLTFGHTNPSTLEVE